MTNAIESELRLIPAPARVYRGSGILATLAPELAALGRPNSGSARLLAIGGRRSLAVARQILAPAFADSDTVVSWTTYGADCTAADLARLRREATDLRATEIAGIGGGKALDAAKLVAHQLHLPVATIPTSAATCAAWTALSNVYSETGAFQYDVPLDRAPDLLILDYELVRQAPPVTLRAGIGDALAKWYEASVSSSDSPDVLTIAAVQQARVLRDLLLQKSVEALEQPGSLAWQQVVDACVCLAGVMGGLGGPKCRTVAAHAVHNGLTHLVGHSRRLHGEKVAFGILVQLRLEEILQGRQLAAAARQQLLSFYEQIQLPTTLEELQMAALQADPERPAQHLDSFATVARIACSPTSDIHHLPFAVTPEALVVALTTTRLPVAPERPVLSPY